MKINIPILFIVTLLSGIALTDVNTPCLYLRKDFAAKNPKKEKGSFSIIDELVLESRKVLKLPDSIDFLGTIMDHLLGDILIA